MSYLKIGPIEVLTGADSSRVPYSTSLLVRGNDHSSLIDCGSGYQAFDYLLKEHQVKEIYLTHYHIDHIWGAHLFPHAEKRINPYDRQKVSNLLELAKANGIFAVYGKSGAQQWVKNEEQFSSDLSLIRGPSWKKCMGLVDSIYSYNQVIDLAGVKMVMIHSPGHCEGFCCPYFPDYGILHIGDIDLTSFGPWYCNADSDIDQFIQSARRTLDIDAKYFITSHQKGIVHKEEYQQKLEDYLSIIERRQEKIKQAIKKGCLPEELVYQEIFYFKKNHEQSPQFIKFELMGLAKHLKRLINHGESFEDYYEEFIAVHGMQRDFIDYYSLIK